MLYELFRVLSRVLGALLWRLEVRGAGNVPRKGGAILASNHQSFLDVFLLGAASPRQVRYLARRTLWDSRVLGAWMTAVGAIPIDRERPGKDALRGVLDTARGGAVLGLFPEGTRTRDGCVGELRGGIGFLARKAGVPVVPVLIEGAWRAWPRGQWLPGPGRVCVTVGRPVLYDESWEDREAAADIRRRLLALRDGTDEPRRSPDGGRAACAPPGGEGAA